mmetsp:Transcript_12064/g.28592  ORF Transcript_12064/g.28592 Transcript_12064/m.28592 type:complete len:108 (-) Transcript_12064:32-355(-)
MIPIQDSKPEGELIGMKPMTSAPRLPSSLFQGIETATDYSENRIGDWRDRTRDIVAAALTIMHETVQIEGRSRCVADIAPRDPLSSIHNKDHQTVLDSGLESISPRQ